MRVAMKLAGIAAALWAGALAAQDFLGTRSGWQVGGQLARYHYEEPDFIWIKGNRLGVTGAYTATNEKRVYGRIEARWSYGELDYQGSGTLQGVPDHLLEVRLLGGRDYPRGSLVWSPYAGAAFRYLHNDLRGITSTGQRGYRRESYYFYVPLGVTLRMPLGRSWALAPQLEYNGFVRGVQRTHLSDTGLGFNDISNRQHRGRGYRAQLMVEGERWTFGPWLHYWNIRDSDIRPIGPGLGGLEPANWTRESGAELRYRF